MSDPFIDALHDRLTRADATGPAERDRDGEREAALTRWWEEFVDLLGQKVGAWNERQAPRQPINFTRHASGRVDVWHRRAEATFSRDREGIRVSTRLGTELREVTLAMRTGPDGNIVALADGDELRTPVAAAEHALTPVLVETFVNP
jgi:hypothetical protein